MLRFRANNVYAASFSMETYFYETSNVLYLEYCTYFHKNVNLSKYNKNKG